MTEKNPNGRLEMFSDGVFAIAITLLILEIKVPPLESMTSRKDVWKAIEHLWPSFLALSLSFIIILISWIGHHNTLRLLDKTSDRFQFANGFLLFTVAFLPFPTAFMAQYLNTPYAQPAIVFYCVSNLFHNIGWRVFHHNILKPASLAKDVKCNSLMVGNSKASRLGTYTIIAIIIVAWWLPYIALILSCLIWIYWAYISLAGKQIIE